MIDKLELRMNRIERKLEVLLFLSIASIVVKLVSVALTK